MGSGEIRTGRVEGHRGEAGRDDKARKCLEMDRKERKAEAKVRGRVRGRGSKIGGGGEAEGK